VEKLFRDVPYYRALRKERGGLEIMFVRSYASTLQKHESDTGVPSFVCGVNQSFVLQNGGRINR